MIEIFNINGKNKELSLKADSTLLEALRENGFTEVKNGCEEGQCGACLVLVDDQPVNSCQILAMSVKDKDIVTSKGLGRSAQTLFNTGSLCRCRSCTMRILYSRICYFNLCTFEEKSKSYRGRNKKCT